MRIRRLTLGPLDTNCWLVDDGEAGPLLVIDPADDPKVILEAIGGEPVEAVVLTHGHFDHLGAVADVLESTGAPLLIHEADAGNITTAEGTMGALFGFYAVAPEAHRELADGDLIEAGGVSLKVINTPGHTPGSVCLYTPGHLFTGDTVFSGSVGRSDFEGGDPHAMRASVARLAELPDATRIYPGHGPESTIARERKVNPYFPRA